MRALLTLFAAILTTVAAAQAPTKPLPGSFAELGDFRGAARRKSWRTLQASGYDRGGGFYDSGNFLRVEPGNRCVLLEAEGPGCIDRMWFTRKSVAETYDLLFYVDDRERPALRIGLDELCSGDRPPFVSPFVGSVNLARYCYVPIAFRRYCKVALVPTAPADRYNYRENSAGKKIPHVYYQITYRSLGADAEVRPFSASLEEAEVEAQRRVAAIWRSTGDPLPHNPDNCAPVNTSELQSQTDLPSGAAVDLFQSRGGGRVEALHLRVTGEARPQDLWLEAYWDGEPRPAISAPLGTFFAAPDPRVPVHGLWSGSRGGEFYCYLPMPFRRSARFRLRSAAAADAAIEARAVVRMGAPGADDAYLHVERYDHQPPLPPAHYQVLDVRGRGHFVGLVMDRPGNMEGDDQFFVDGEVEPSIHGTGTEDFFNFAWGFSHLAALPLHGITKHFGAAIPYRFHLPAGVPFQRSLRVAFEHGHGNEHQGRYSGAAFYYLSPHR
ncbi:MAG: glycoside hydrolase family 172 protein [Actinomycetota bacterium]